MSASGSLRTENADEWQSSGAKSMGATMSACLRTLIYLDLALRKKVIDTEFDLWEEAIP